MEKGRVYLRKNGTFITYNNDKLKDNTYNEDPIYLFQQFFIHSNKERYSEIKECLRRNILLGLFKKIYLFNERIYTNSELGLNNDEMKQIEQINIGMRMNFSICFQKIKQLNIKGYIVLSNSDIFFDKTVVNVRRSCLSETKSLYALLRFEYLNQEKLGFCKLFTYTNRNIPREDSQDVWIYHTNFTPNENSIDYYNFTALK